MGAGDVLGVLERVAEGSKMFRAVEGALLLCDFSCTCADSCVL